MSNIYDFFLDIKCNPLDYIIVPNKSGFEDDSFENHIKEKLDSFGYSEIKFNKGSNKLQKDWEKFVKKDDKPIKNTTKFNKHYIYQPFGTQKYPDILILEDKTVFCLELKSSKGTRPIWNSGLPKANGIYIFASYSKKDITFFRGSDILGNTDRQKLLTFFKNSMEDAELFNKKYMSSQEFGFGVYARKMYENKRTFNPQAIINFFKNNKREWLENEVLEYCKTLRSYTG